jgi:hypothetical protein
MSKNDTQRAIDTTICQHCGSEGAYASVCLACSYNPFARDYWYGPCKVCATVCAHVKGRECDACETQRINASVLNFSRSNLPH